MSKRDDLLRAGAGNILSSMGAGGGGLPAGLDPSSAARRPAHLEGVSKEKAAARIALGRIVRDESQPREEFDPEALGRLAESLRARGQLQPIRVRWDEGRGAYVVLVGERRWRAAALAGMTELSCLVEERDLSAGERLAVQMVENALREDLRPVEQAKAYKALMAAQGWSGNQLAKELHIAQASVSRALALLDLSAEIQGQVERGELPATTAAEIARLPEAERSGVAEAVVSAGLSRAEVSEVVAAVRAKRPSPAARPEPVTFDVGGATVRVSWRKADGPTLTQALRKALKQAQERDGAAA